MRSAETKAITLLTKIKLRKLRQKMLHADGQGRREVREDCRICINAIQFKCFWNTTHGKEPIVDYDYD